MLEDKKINWAGLLNLFVIYIIWGSTYLAIRVAVREGSGFPPFTLGGTRVISAGLVLLMWGGFRKFRIIPTREEIIHLMVSGILLWVGGNGLVNWAEQRAESGLAALIISATPIWAAIVTIFFDKKLPSGKMIAALFLGFVGMIVLSVPILQAGIRTDIWSIFGLLLAGLSWGTGSVLQSRRPIDLNAVVSAGYQQVIGGLGLLGIAFLIREPAPHPIFEAWLAWGYLWFFGSILAFTSFVRALRILPTKIVMTYPYVNPVIAVFLGWVILDESVSLWTLMGATLILAGVAGVFRERYRE